MCLIKCIKNLFIVWGVDFKVGIVIGMLIGRVRKMQDIAILLREKKFLKFYIA